MPAVSVIVPVYNSELYLRECVDSILAQTFSDFELILINDGSTDNSAEICDEYKCDERVKVLHQKNLGVSAARNNAIDLACGKYIMFVDSDDTITPFLLSEAYEEIEKNKAVLFVCGLSEDFVENGEIIRTNIQSISQDRLYTISQLFENFQIDYSLNFLYGPCQKLYLSKIIKDNHVRFPENLSFGEDACFNMEYFQQSGGGDVYFSKSVHYHYRRINSESLSRKFLPDFTNVFETIHEKTRTTLVEFGCSDNAMLRFENLCFSTLVSGLYSFYEFRKKTTFSQRREQLKNIANNPHIKKLHVLHISHWKLRIIFLLMKMRLFFLLEVLFIFKKGFETANE